MLSDDSVATIEHWWAADLGCTVEDMRGDQLLVTRQGGRSVFVLALKGVVVSVPTSVDAQRVIGPAFIGYADASSYRSDGSGARAHILDGASERLAIDELRAAVSAVEWEHGGAEKAEAYAGVFDGARLAALASYERWGERIAHISVVARPAHRSRGYGRAAVDALASAAVARGLVAQYRTLIANAPSMAIARHLGFERWAVSLAVRID